MVWCHSVGLHCQCWKEGRDCQIPKTISASWSKRWQEIEIDWLELSCTAALDMSATSSNTNLHWAKYQQYNFGFKITKKWFTRYPSFHRITKISIERSFTWDLVLAVMRLLREAGRRETIPTTVAILFVVLCYCWGRRSKFKTDQGWSLISSRSDRDRGPLWIDNKKYNSLPRSYDWMILETLQSTYKNK